MINRIKIVLSVLIIMISFLVIHGFSPKKDSYYKEKIKVALRAVGNKLLLENNDTTSRIMPIREISDNQFKLSFQKKLGISPEVLVTAINAELKKIKISEDYLTEVIDCEFWEVAYSYQVLDDIEKNTISCLDRKLPVSCYMVQIVFLNNNSTSMYSSFNMLYMLPIVVLLIIFISGTRLLGKKKVEVVLDSQSKDIVLGNFLFDKNQQKLKIDTTEIILTAKECELLSIFSQYPNQIIKREQLIKEVWEDHGVFVGRSLDMFISKLRKKLNNDANVNIVNIHGVGYKLEVVEN
ncbi:winged helix-turn-helix domain-containing protein [Aquimarina sp. 2201CG14-23]|uniref:winged helix-turn-helix domain-containing protein n=1 Tax=Aquimarina mycalae TaxID=3040073 RepID=UPI00247813B8|nr:winged helix-turn-helix domain-containing protein [Aquimarina sp. 2201CG14-23]MDH7445551.1 winged helix-turn-helix domain-containing protein [Aquimarina sp. 2201CG14-23]